MRPVTAITSELWAWVLLELCKREEQDLNLTEIVAEKFGVDAIRSTAVGTALNRRGYGEIWRDKKTGALWIRLSDEARRHAGPISEALVRAGNDQWRSRTVASPKAVTRRDDQPKEEKP